MTGNLSVRNGIWYAILYYKNPEGQYKQKWISTGLKERGNKKEAQKILNNLFSKYSYLENAELFDSNQSQQKKFNKTEKTSQGSIPFIVYIRNFIEDKKEELSPSVYYTYSHSLLKVISEYFEPLKLQLKDVTTDHILEFYSNLKSKGIKNVTLKHYGNIIRPALRKAFKEKIIPENPYDFMPTINKEKRTPTYYDQNDMEKFFEVIKGHHLELAFHMLAFYGLRRSELLGIRWQAIDFSNKTITINHKVLNINGELYLSDTMKTKSSCRTLPLVSQMENELLQHKNKIEKNMQYFGKSYNMKFVDYVFVHENGDLVLPDCLTHNMLKIIRRFHLKPIRLHDLRHSCASIMIKNGIQMKQIQEWLGHSNFSTTADIYSHLDFSSKIESAEKMASALKFETENNESTTNDIKPIVPKEIEEYNAEKMRDEQIENIFYDLKKQMKSLGFTKLSELFTYIENDGDLSNDNENEKTNSQL